MFRSVQYLDGQKEKESEVVRPGKVRAEFQNGDVFEGEYTESRTGFVRTGKGTYTWRSKAKYEGDYKEGKRHGQGTYTFPSGEQYDGKWVDGVKSGQGKYLYTNGDEFHGTWVGDKRNGEGRFVNLADRMEITGLWKDGHLVESTMSKRQLPEKQEAQPEIQNLSSPVRTDMSVSSTTPRVDEVDHAKKLETMPTIDATEPETLDKMEELASEAANSEPIDEPDDKSQAPQPMFVIITGPPAGGKGTQCARIAESFGVVHLSTGDLLRQAIRDETELGMKAKAFMDDGKLVPDEIVNEILRERLQQDDVKQRGVLLDGYPRTETQAKELEESGFNVDACLLLEVPDDVVIERAVGRRLDPHTNEIYHMQFRPPPEDDPEVMGRLIQRTDDTAEKMEERLAHYQLHLENLRKFYDRVLHPIDGRDHPEKVWDTVKELLVDVEKRVARRGKETEEVYDIVQHPIKDETDDADGNEANETNENADDKAQTASKEVEDEVEDLKAAAGADEKMNEKPEGTKSVDNEVDDKPENVIDTAVDVAEKDGDDVAEAAKKVEAELEDKVVEQVEKKGEDVDEAEKDGDEAKDASKKNEEKA